MVVGDRKKKNIDSTQRLLLVLFYIAGYEVSGAKGKKMNPVSEVTMYALQRDLGINTEQLKPVVEKLLRLEFIKQREEKIPIKNRKNRFRYVYNISITNQGKKFTSKYYSGFSLLLSDLL